MGYEDAKKLTESDISLISATAIKVLDLYDQLKKGYLSELEYDELVGDLLSLEKIEENMYTQETYITINRAFNALNSLKSLIAVI